MPHAVDLTFQGNQAVKAVTMKGNYASFQNRNVCPLPHKHTLNFCLAEKLTTTEREFLDTLELKNL